MFHENHSSWMLSSILCIKSEIVKKFLGTPKKIGLTLRKRYQKILACKSSLLSVEDLHARIFWYLHHNESAIFFGESEQIQQEAQNDILGAGDSIPRVFLSVQPQVTLLHPLKPFKSKNRASKAIFWISEFALKWHILLHMPQYCHFLKFKDIFGIFSLILRFPMVWAMSRAYFSTPWGNFTLLHILHSNVTLILNRVICKSVRDLVSGL